MNALIEFLVDLVRWTMDSPTHPPAFSEWHQPGFRVNASPVFNEAGEPGASLVATGNVAFYRTAEVAA